MTRVINPSALRTREARAAALPQAATIQARLAALDWPRLEADLWGRGYAQTDPVLTMEECRELVALYSDDRRFRSRIDMARHRFGEGDYKYFAEPLPGGVEPK